MRQEIEFLFSSLSKAVDVTREIKKGWKKGEITLKKWPSEKKERGSLTF